LLDAALIQGYTTIPSVGGLQFRFEHHDLVIASLADEWVLARGGIPQNLKPYLPVGQWLVRMPRADHVGVGPRGDRPERSGTGNPLGSVRA
jgi:hypothetical protein